MPRASAAGDGSGRPAATAWRWIVTDPAPGAWNMAVDEALMESVRAGAPPALRFYRWSPACLSLGRNQPASGVYDPIRLRQAGVDIVRRPTGGRSVLHDRELTYSVVAPDRAFGTVRAAYLAVNSALVAGLTNLGAPAVLHGDGVEIPVPSTDPCFARPVPGEVMFNGRKLAGSAQVRVRGVILQHGSVPLGPSRLAERLARSGLVSTGDPADVESAIRRPVGFDEVCDALVRAWSESIGRCSPTSLAAEELGRAAVHERRYGDDSWTWRR